MKVKVSNLLTSFAVIFLLAFTVQAQEGMPLIDNPDPNHRELNFNEDKTLIYDHPGHSSTVRDTTQMVARPVVNSTLKVVKPENHKKEEDALSFNFLYYMIQKFKMSDLIDQY